MLWCPNTGPILIIDIAQSMIRVVNLSSPQLTNIKTITQILPLSQNHIIIVGHSTHSLKRLQLLYEVYDVDTKQPTRTGTISKFGIIFLTSYINYHQIGSFLALISVMGTRRIVKQNFTGVEPRTIVREVQIQRFQQRAKNQNFSLHYSSPQSRIYLLEQLQFGQYQHQMIIRVYTEGVQVDYYRIVSLQQVPRLIWSPHYMVLESYKEVTIYKNNFEPSYFTLQNMEQFNILGFCQEFILQLRQSQAIYTMSMSGVIRPLLDEAVCDYHFTSRFLYFLLARKLDCSGSVKVFKIGEEGVKYQQQIQNCEGCKIQCGNGWQLVLKVP